MCLVSFIYSDWNLQQKCMSVQLCTNWVLCVGLEIINKFMRHMIIHVNGPDNMNYKHIFSLRFADMDFLIDTDVNNFRRRQVVMIVVYSAMRHRSHKTQQEIVRGSCIYGHDKMCCDRFYQVLPLIRKICRRVILQLVRGQFMTSDIYSGSEEVLVLLCTLIYALAYLESKLANIARHTHMSLVNSSR